ncbi:hypothetical protein AB1Y20_013264 [Prymnesium parvum]|uniref:Protein kinase domain-containing protein n=1 Tax=Prymnesium parvum TaxID=97485 RepID=A0AB34IN22_PRYPA
MKREREAEGSSRAARSGQGAWELSQAAGELDAEYATLGVLGRGTFSEVNLVRHRQSGELAVVKFCCKLDALSYAHLRTEAELAKKLRKTACGRSPFVLVPTASADSTGRAGSFSLLLPLCPGGDLLQLMRRQPAGVLSEEATRSYGAMVVLGLLALHAAGVVYRDLKPENLLLRASGHLAIADFGFTGTLAQCKRRLKVGTPAYQAPEIVRKSPHDATVDWWALGCVLLEMMCGEQVFAAGCEDDEAIEQRILAHEGGIPPLSPPIALSEGGADFIGRLLEPSPATRLGVAAQVGRDVQDHAWFAAVDWEAMETLSTPPPFIPPALPLDDDDATLVELTSRCQDGFR